MKAARRPLIYQSQAFPKLGIRKALPGGGSVRASSLNFEIGGGACKAISPLLSPCIVGVIWVRLARNSIAVSIAALISGFLRFSSRVRAYR